MNLEEVKNRPGYVIKRIGKGKYKITTSKSDQHCDNCEKKIPPGEPHVGFIKFGLISIRTHLGCFDE